MRLRMLLPTALVLLGAAATPAGAVTLREIVDLTHAGLSDEVLVALVEVDARVFPIDAATIKWLNDSGVSPRVIETIVRSGRSAPREPAAPEAAPDVSPDPPSPPAPQVIVIEHEAPSPVVVPVPVYFTVRVRPVRAQRSVRALNVPVGAFFNATTGRAFINDGAGRPTVPLTMPDSRDWGGKPRPDARKPAGER